jgi:hypothetical protein
MNELIQNLVNNLGVKEDQAKGGTGLLFKLAKEKLGGGEFSQISEHVPGIEDLVQAALEGGGGGWWSAWKSGFRFRRSRLRIGKHGESRRGVLQVGDGQRADQ